MIAVDMAKTIAMNKFPKYVIYSILEYPDSYAVSMGPKEKPIWWMDCWVCLDKNTGKEIEGRSFSSPDDFKNSKVISD